VGYSLGRAASVLWLGALGDRYGRKPLLVLGVVLSVPACVLAAYAPSDSVLIVARLLGGHGLSDHTGADHGAVVGGWADAVDRAVVGTAGAIASLGPLLSGWLLERLW
jgi:DHA2 family multidrug resistance protein-like MFS transporter